MRISAQAFWSPKAGNEESEYEDAFWPERSIIGKEGAVFRFAVGDGATEASFSGVWAKQLVRAFCQGKFEGQEFPRCLRILRERWLEIVTRKSLPWYAEEKLRSGAFAAIVGIVLDETSDVEQAGGAWRAFAIGDSCVAQLREKKFVTSFPLQSSDQFSSSPELLASKGLQDRNDAEALLTVSGKWEKGDAFYLMSDAIACWFLTQVEGGRLPARQLEDLSCRKGGFSSWVEGLREAKVVKNDDVTILRVEIER